MFQKFRLRTTLILSYFLVVLIALAVVGGLALPLLVNSQNEKDDATYDNSKGVAASALDRARGLITAPRAAKFIYLGVENPFKPYYGTPITPSSQIFNYPPQPDLDFVRSQFAEIAARQNVQLLVLQQGTVEVDTAPDHALIGFSLNNLYATVTAANSKPTLKIRETTEFRCAASNIDYCQEMTLPTNGAKATIVYKTVNAGDIPNLFGLNPQNRRPLEYLLAAVVLVPPHEPVLSNLAKILAVAGVAALVVAFVAGLILARSIAKPLVKVTAATEAIARGDYSQTVAVQGGAELARLAESFNHMTHEVEEYQRMQRELIANVSHELKTPLTAIRGFSQAMTDGTLRHLEDFALPAQIISKETERTIRLVNSLLELSKLESGTARFNKEPLDLAELLDGTLVSFSPRANENGVLLINQIQPTLPILGDQDRLRQVFNNLIDNALKYTPPDGQIEISCRQSGKQVVVSVADTGAGIPQADLPHVFERFYQADKSRSKPVEEAAGGLGLGLAICREIILAHGGKIEVESTPTLGTKFTVTLPTLEARSGPTASRSETPLRELVKRA